MLDDWLAALADELGVDLDVDIEGLLDLAGVAAHTVTRPAAPLTTFLVGYAAAARGGGPEVVAELTERARVFARAYAPESPREP